MSNFNNIFENKTQYEKKFCVILTVKSGYNIDYGGWIERPYRDEFDDNGFCLNRSIPWDLLELTVSIDKVVLYQGPINIEGIQIRYFMPDSDTVQQHSLTIAVSGFTSAHAFFYNGQEIKVQTQITEFKVENLDLLALTQKMIMISDGPSEGNPGYSQTLDFNTPIYTWLLSNFLDLNGIQKKMLSKFSHFN